MLKKLSAVAVLGLALALALGACSDDDDTNNPDNGGGNNNGGSHLGGTPTANGTCDNPSDAPNNCYAYVGSSFVGDAGKESCNGTYSSTQGCTATGRSGRCTLYAGTENEFVAHCYDPLSQCQSFCSAVEGTFQAN